jgi:pyruvate/2-oxoglutarate dehydrogenase complex dihydrolipoamide acyltransferase (E2) component
VIEVRVPDIGDFADVPIIEVLVEPGAAVEAEDPLITLESDKATMDVPSPAAGVIDEIAVKVGDKVSQGTLIARLDAKEEESRSTATAKEPAAPEQPVAASRGGTAPVEQEEPEKAFRDVPAKSAGGRAAPAETEEPARPFEEQPPATPRKEHGGPTATVPPPAEASAPPAAVDEQAFRTAHASPGVRKLARELGVDLGRVAGTGPKSRILPQDLYNFVKSAIAGAAAPARFAGSLLQLDFGERDQRKSVSIVDAAPGMPARVREVPITAGRRLLDVHGTLDEVLARGREAGDAYVRAFVATDGPVPGIADRIRTELPNALDVHLVYDRDRREPPSGPPVSALAPREQFLAYYRSAHGADPEAALLEAFDELLAAEGEGA